MATLIARIDDRFKSAHAKLLAKIYLDRKWQVESRNCWLLPPFCDVPLVA